MKISNYKITDKLI